MNLNIRKYFSVCGWLSTAQVSQRGCWVSILVDARKLPGQQLGQLSFNGSVWAGVGWNRWSPEVLSTLSHSRILWSASSVRWIFQYFPKRNVSFSQVQHFLLNGMTFYRFSFQQDQLDYSNFKWNSNCDVSTPTFFNSEVQLIECYLHSSGAASLNSTNTSIALMKWDFQKDFLKLWLQSRCLFSVVCWLVALPWSLKQQSRRAWFFWEQAMQ